MNLLIKITYYPTRMKRLNPVGMDVRRVSSARGNQEFAGILVFPGKIRENARNFVKLY